MQFTTEVYTFQGALKRAARVIERRNTIPILGNLMLRIDDGNLLVTGTDLDIITTVRVGTEFGSAVDGAVTVPGHMVRDFVAKLPTGAQVAFEYLGTEGKGETQATIKAGRARAKFSILPAVDFPTFGTIVAGGGDVAEFKMAARDLARVISAVSFAISTEETRYYLNGIFMHRTTDKSEGKDVLCFVATDGHRLAKVSIPLPAGAEDLKGTIQGVIIPRKTVGEIERITKEVDGDSEIGVRVNSAKIEIDAGNLHLTSKLIDGTFPDYNRVIPRGNNIVAEIAVDDLSAAVDRVQTIQAERGRGVKLSLSAGTMRLEASSVDSGTATEEIGIDFDGDAAEIGFNSRYVLDVVSKIEGDKVRLAISDPGSPALLTDPSDPSILMVLMPLRV